MARYDKVFGLLAERAARIGAINAETFIHQQQLSGVPQDRIIEMLLEDIGQDAGPVFGAFKRSLVGAVVSSVAAAVRQGEIVGAVDQMIKRAGA